MTLEQRYSKAIEQIGGAPGLLALPEWVKKRLQRNVRFERKVEMLELVAQNMDLMKTPEFKAAENAMREEERTCSRKS